jgi:large exoprotein involved in heme utilization and adhesion
VTGGNASTIDGLLQIRNAQAPVHLFMLNPAGVMFGANARLDLPGSLLVSTASQVNFADGVTWGTTVAPAPLSISAPIGLQFGTTPGAIEVQGTGHTFTQSGVNPVSRVGAASGLINAPFQGITLVGGAIDLRGGSLTAPAGLIELGAVGAQSLVTVALTPIGWQTDYGGVSQFGPVTLTNRALMDVSGGPLGTGSVMVRGSEIGLDQGSMILGLSTGPRPIGSLNLRGTDIILQGAGTNGFQTRIESGTLGPGLGSNISIEGDRLKMQKGALLRAYTFGSGMSGDILINTRDSVIIQGVLANDDPTLGTAINVASFLGQTGKVQIDTTYFSVLNGGIVGSAAFGVGRGGSTIVNAKEILVSGFSVASQIASTVSSTGFGSGAAGNLIFNSERLRVEGGAAIGGTIFGSGAGSNVIVNASKSITVQGASQTGAEFNGSTITASASILPTAVRQRIGGDAIPTGNAGNVVINSPVVTVSDRASIGARNAGSGTGGYIMITSDRLVLDQKALINASTTSKKGGDINITSNVLVLRRESSITARAGGSGNGGNIRLTTGYLVAPPTENSDIIATAIAGSGGQIQINARGIFGIQPRSTLTPRSDISANSAFGSNGTVLINGLVFNSIVPNSTLPTQLKDADQPLTVNCEIDPTQAFNISGRGGLPEDPTPPPCEIGKCGAINAKVQSERRR